MMHLLIKLFIISNCFHLLFIDRSGASEIEYHPNLNLLSKVCGTINEDYILSDKPHFEEFPWMALIFGTKSDGTEEFLRSGTIINTRYVLTMSECDVKDYNHIRRVRIGEYNIKTATDCEDDGSDTICALPPKDIAVENVDIYPESHSNASCTNCITLLRLETPIDFKQPNTGAICLPTESDLSSRNLTGVRGTLAGWRLFNNPDTLRKSTSTIVSEDECKEYIREKTRINKLPLNTVCVKGSLHFETGAPFMVKAGNRGNKRYTLYGMLSTGLRDSDINLFIEITRYLKWILDTIKV